MTPIRHLESARVVVGVDGSENARHAAVWAAHEAEARDVPLTLLHAFGATGGIPPALGPIAHQARRGAEGRTYLEAAAALIGESHPALLVETELCPLTPVERLVELSGKGAVIVTGTRGLGGLAGMLLGSVSRALAAQTRGPLVVVRGPRAGAESGAESGAVSGAESGAEEGPVVLGVGHEPADAAVEYAFAAAQRSGTSVHAISAASFSPPLAEVEMPVLMPAGLGVRSTRPPVAQRPRAERDRAVDLEAAELVRELEAAHARYPGVHASVTVAAGDVAEFLTAEGEHAQLVVVGTAGHRSRGPLPAGPGHLVGRLLSHCPAPVAVIPAAGG